MNGALFALLFVIGALLLGTGLIAITLPLLSDTSISLPWLILGGICLAAGAFALWFVRNEAKLQASTPSAGNGSFFTVLGILNVLILVLSVRKGEWPSVLVAGAAAGVVVLLVKAIARRRAK